ncbi:MAG: glycosyltransferase family 4 protein, partial [Bacteroidales bacterium]|nr:glycosyltransferase family 4 protein [Bacteroidales bacterium]
VNRKYSISRKMHLIHNGVATPEDINEPGYFRHLGIEHGKYILGMCRFAPEKNLHQLIQAFSKIDSHGYKLVIAGDSDFEDSYSIKLRKLAKENGVILTGFIKGRRLHALLNHCRCYVLPSSHEGLPIALLEAMSYGAPILVSDIPANLEVGLPRNNYFHCNDVLELTAKLQETVDMPYEKCSYDMEKYDWDVIAKQVSQVYRSL